VVFVDHSERLTDPALQFLCRSAQAILIVLTELPAVDALCQCRDFLLWPCPEQELELRLQRLCRRYRPGSGGHDGDDDDPGEFARFNLIGRSPVFKDCLRMIKKLARWSVPVLIQGETGTGKELAARALHYLGARRGKPFIPLNCGALPDTLFVNELFGHERGAFTDARTGHRGLIAQAEGGTLFLDEVDSLSPENQATLLRFLQDRCYRPLGGEHIAQADVTVIAATNVDLKQQIHKGLFRQDLLYRLNVTELTMPSLRQRRSDIALLAEYFLQRFGDRYGGIGRTLTPQSLDWLERQTWPGNVRELENLIHRELLLAEGVSIDIDTSAYQSGVDSASLFTADKAIPFSFEEGFNRTRDKLLLEFERRYLDQLMHETGGNVSQAARLAGKERRHLGRLLQKHGIMKENYFRFTREEQA
jgi:DNA-binding NtrC family response regulator